MSEHTPAPVVTEPTKLPRVWPWVAGVAALAAIGGGIAVAATGDSETKAFCADVADAAPASSAYTKSGMSYSAYELRRALDRHPGADSWVRNIASNLASTYERGAQPQSDRFAADGLPTGDSLRHIAWMMDGLADSCG